jgi:hypothetical protein
MKPPSHRQMLTVASPDSIASSDFIAGAPIIGRSRHPATTPPQKEQSVAILPTGHGRGQAFGDYGDAQEETVVPSE